MTYDPTRARAAGSDASPGAARERARPGDAYRELWNDVPGAAGALAVLDDAGFGDEALVEEPAGSPLARYFPYQLRDWLVRRGALIAPILLFGTWFTWRTLNAESAQRLIESARQQAAEAAAKGLPPIEVPVLVDIVARHVLAAGLIGTVIVTVMALFGVVSVEREKGLQRFLFAKPVGVAAWYLQKFGVALLGAATGLMLVALALGAVFAVPVPFAQLVGMGLCVMLPVGGLVFLLSTLVRFDAAIALVITVSQFPLQELRNERLAPEWLRVAAEWLQYLAPPLRLLFDRTQEILPAPTPTAFAASLAYALVCVLAGVAVLRRRSIIV